MQQVADIRETSERYISKTQPWIILEGTIGSPTGLLSQIWKEEPCLYTKVKISYEDGLREGMYTEAHINRARQSHSFNRELLCDFSAAAMGNTFPAEWVERAFNIIPASYLDENSSWTYTLSVDPGWAPSRTGVCLLG